MYVVADIILDTKSESCFSLIRQCSWWPQQLYRCCKHTFRNNARPHHIWFQQLISYYIPIMHWELLRPSGRFPQDATLAYVSDGQGRLIWTGFRYMKAVGRDGMTYRVHLARKQMSVLSQHVGHHDCGQLWVGVWIDQAVRRQRVAQITGLGVH